MNAETKQLLIATLEEMARNLRRSFVADSAIHGAVRTTAGNLFGNDYGEIVAAVLGGICLPPATRPTPRKIAIRRGSVVFLTPVDEPHVRMRFVAEGDSGGDVLALWNGNNGIMASRPVITRQPDGTWANGVGSLYTVDVSG